MRRLIARHVRGNEPGFRWRGSEVSRVEALSDAVFGFAVTLLVVSLEVPNTMGELMAVMRGFGAFAICFTLLILIWYGHYLYFRRYGLNDRLVIVLNAILLFLVLFYVYPLKFLFTLLVNGILHAMGALGGVEDAHFAEAAESMMGDANGTKLLVIYGAGYFAVSMVFVLLYVHAWKKRDELELDANERSITLEHLQAHGIVGGSAVLSITLALCGQIALAGWCYGLIGPARAFHGWRMGVKRERRNGQT